MDEKRFEIIANIVEKGGMYELTDEEGEEIIRLARLGLWAEQHAIGAFQRIVLTYGFEVGNTSKAEAKQALDALPKSTGGE